MMTDDPNNPYRDTFEEPVAHQRRSSNVLGIVGFVFAFCVPPLGLLLSIIAVFRTPRAFAIAGIVVSLITTAIVAVLVLSFGVMGKYMFAGIELVMDVQQIGQAAEGYASSNGGAAPPNMAALQLPTDTITDPWGQPYTLTPGDAGAWTLGSAGMDGSWNTDDDLTIDSSMDSNAIGEAFGRTVEAHFKAKGAGRTP